jgi:hypothetical protein
MTVDEAIKAARENVTDEYAVAYLDALPQAIEMGGADLVSDADHALKVNILYALNNMKSWRGDVAREAKAVLKQYATKRGTCD